MSDSASSSASSSTTSQTTGSSGNESPTVTAGGNVTLKTGGQEITLAALQGMQDVVTTALQSSLSAVSQASGQQMEAAQAEGVNDTTLLQSILASNSQLAQNSQTGGATAAISQTNYIIWGLIGLAALALAGLAYWLFRKK